jgi:hypothetical protein
MALPSPILSCMSRPRYTVLRLAAGRSGGCGRGALGTPHEPARRGRRRGALGGAPEALAHKCRVNFLSALVKGAQFCDRIGFRTPLDC